MAKQPASKPVPDDEVPERVVADPARQESGTRDWSGDVRKDQSCG